MRKAKPGLLALLPLLPSLLVGCRQASSIGIIGSADGPTSIFVASKTAGPRLSLLLAGLVVIIVGVIVYFVRRK